MPSPLDPLASPASAATFTIHDLVREFGVTARTLRFYEEKGLLAPARIGTGEAARRVFSRRDRARLKLVLMGKSVGFSLEEVRDMLDLYDRGDGGAAQRQLALGQFEAKIADLQARRSAIDTALAELLHARDLIKARLIRETTPTNA